jgi:hypothetical protein
MVQMQTIDPVRDAATKTFFRFVLFRRECVTREQSVGHLVSDTAKAQLCTAQWSDGPVVEII